MRHSLISEIFSVPKVLENTLLYGCTCLVVFASRTIILRGRGTGAVGGGGWWGGGREIPLDCKAEEDLLKQNGVNLLRRAVNYKGTVKTLRPSNTKRKQLALSPFS